MTNEVPGTEYYDENGDSTPEYSQEVIEALWSATLYYNYMTEKGLFQNGATKEELDSWAAEYENMSDDELFKFLGYENEETN